MPQLIYSSLASLDGYMADESGGFGWAVPDEEVLAFITELEPAPTSTAAGCTR